MLETCATMTFPDFQRNGMVPELLYKNLFESLYI